MGLCEVWPARVSRLNSHRTGLFRSRWNWVIGLSKIALNVFYLSSYIMLSRRTKKKTKSAACQHIPEGYCDERRNCGVKSWIVVPSLHWMTELDCDENFEGVRRLRPRNSEKNYEAWIQSSKFSTMGTYHNSGSCSFRKLFYPAYGHHLSAHASTHPCIHSSIGQWVMTPGSTNRLGQHWLRVEKRGSASQLVFHIGLALALGDSQQLSEWDIYITYLNKKAFHGWCEMTTM